MRGDRVTEPTQQHCESQRWLRRATEVAIAGRHHMLVIGAAGTGKRKFALESARELAKERGGEQMPVRMPHASVTPLGMLKWKGDATGGEIERACGGVLILEDVAEMNGPVLKGLREPLRDRQLTQGVSTDAHEPPMRMRSEAAQSSEGHIDDTMTGMESR